MSLVVTSESISFRIVTIKARDLFAYEYNGYWKDVGTLGSYWEANMELIDIIPEFNLYEEFWKIYTNSEILPPQYISAQSVIERSIICNGAEVYGEVHNSIIGSGVIIGEGSVIRDSIIMKDTRVGKKLCHGQGNHCRKLPGWG